MKEEDVRVNVRSAVDTGVGEPDFMEFISDGILQTDEDGGLNVLYNESALSGMEGTQTSLRVEGNKAQVSRIGTVNSIMEFEPGKRCLTTYQTPHGDLSMGFTTDSVDIARNGAGEPAQISIRYRIDAAGQEQSRNEITITLKRI